ncbi:MAG: hypothetical protein AAFN10_28285 [Bacteroidota bacterium]
MDEITLINQQLAVYIQEKRELEKLKTRLQKLAQERKYIQERMAFIASRLAEEKSDIERLNRRNKMRLLTPNEDQQAQYDKEVAEYEIVLEHRNQGLTMLSDLDIEERQIHQQIAHIGPIEEEYAKLVKLKERFLRHEGGETYLNLIESLENLKVDRKELQEAITVGGQLGKLLDRMSTKIEAHSVSEYAGEDIEKVFNVILGYLPRAQVAGKQFYKEVREAEERLGLICSHSPMIFLSLHRDFVIEQSAYKKVSLFKRALNNIFDEPYWEKRINTARDRLRKLNWTLQQVMEFLKAELTPIEETIKAAEARKKQMIENIQ